MNGEEINVMAFVKGDDRYIFIFRGDKAPDVLHMMCRWALNPELSFSWIDAEAVSTKVRAMSEAKS
jgi:hypothetical protein